jgi:2-desacetyl-2-hydroxyethyl bacteriochlorophyllide A dehydrogenase
MSRAIVLDGPQRLRLHTRDVPMPSADDVLVRVEWAGICGSDVDLLEGLRPPGLVRYPVVPGHEWAGVVIDVGAAIDRTLVGRGVVAEGIRPCGACAPCRQGNAQQCENAYEETGFTLDGAWADHLVVPAALVHELPDDADLRAAAGIEPAACAAAAVERAEVTAGARVAVVGGGTLGLLTTQLLRATGPSEVLVVEPVAERWDIAERCGATRVVTAATRELDASFDVVVEAAGAAGAAQAAVRLARRGGRVVLAGIPPSNDVLVTQDIVAKQLDVRSVFGASRRAWARAVDAFRDGTLDPGVLVTHEVPLEDARRALELVSERDPTVGKVLLRP